MCMETYTWDVYYLIKQKTWVKRGGILWAKGSVPLLARCCPASELA